MIVPMPAAIVLIVCKTVIAGPPDQNAAYTNSEHREWATEHAMMVCRREEVPMFDKAEPDRASLIGLAWTGRRPRHCHAEALGPVTFLNGVARGVGGGAIFASEGELDVPACSGARFRIPSQFLVRVPPARGCDDARLAQDRRRRRPWRHADRISRIARRLEEARPARAGAWHHVL